MTTFLVFVAVVIFVIAATALWGIIVDGTIHRPPSEWLTSIYLGAFVGLLAAAGMLLDQIRSHLLLASVIGFVGFAALIAFTVLLWKRVKRLDEVYYAKRERSHRHRPV